jgi:hypothetical protein
MMIMYLHGSLVYSDITIEPLQLVYQTPHHCYHCCVDHCFCKYLDCQLTLDPEIGLLTHFDDHCLDCVGHESRFLAPDIDSKSFMINLTMHTFLKL